MVDFTKGIQSDFNLIVDTYGTKVTPSTYTVTIGSYGDETKTYTTGADIPVILQPISSQEIIRDKMGDRIEGQFIGFFKSGNNLQMDSKITYNGVDYSIVDRNDEIISGVVVYQRVVLNKIDDN